MSNLTDVETVKQLKNLDPLRNVPERIVPGHVRTQDLAEHLARYTWAAPRLSGRVLDLGCGVGYGAHHCLSINSDITEVVGVDRNWDTVRFARRTYSTRRLALVGADACRLPFMDGSFDAVACFQAIEHVRSPDVLVDRSNASSTTRTSAGEHAKQVSQFALARTTLKSSSSTGVVSNAVCGFVEAILQGGQPIWPKSGSPGYAWLQCCSIAARLYSRLSFDRLGVLARFRRLYRTVRPYHCDCEAPVEHDVPNAVLEYSQIRKLVPEIVIAVAVRR